MLSNTAIQFPPSFCEYASGPCDQEFEGTRASAIFLYPAEPKEIAQTIEAGISEGRKVAPQQNWRTWREFQTAGQLIFCSICKNMRFAECVVADVTTLNFNLLFEIGFAVGLGLPIIPIRDTTFLRDKTSFEELGILDVIGYVDFQNSYGLATDLLKRIPSPAIPAPPSQLNLEASIYVVKSPIDTEGAIRLMSALKKSTVRFRSYDPVETPRLPLQEARKQIGASEGHVKQDEATRVKLQKLSETYAPHSKSGGGDFSERLLRKVEQISAAYSAESRTLDGAALTRALFGADIRELDDAVADYVEGKESILVLIDNLDKGWPTRGASSEDVLILRTLLEATRKLQRQFDNRRVPFHCLVFIRNDIYEHLIEETPDKGKDTAIILDYDDAEFFKQMVLQRIRSGVTIPGSFDQVWATIFPTHVGTYDAFSYIINRTLMRPRDLLNFLHRAVEVAINRGHDRVLAEDILKAEAIYSEDILKSTSFEIRDVFPSVRDPLYGFLGCASHMTKEEVIKILLESGFPPAECEEALKLLVWFGFLGVQDKGSDRPKFAYEVRYNIDKLLSPINHANCYLVVHPAFHRALECISLV